MVTLKFSRNVDNKLFANNTEIYPVNQLSCPNTALKHFVGTDLAMWDLNVVSILIGSS